VSLRAGRSGRGPITRAFADPGSPGIGTTPAELVHREGSLRLLRYRPEVTRPAGAPPLLLVMPVINRPYVLDLTPAASFVAALRDAGVDTFLLDWGRPGLADRRVGLDDLVARLLPRCEARVLAASDARRLALAGYCLGGTIAVCRAARAATRGERGHAGLATIHAPVSFAEAGLLGAFTREENFPLEALLDAFGNMPGWLLQEGFQGQRPLQRLASWRRLLERDLPPDDLEEFAALERWNTDNVPVTGAFYRRLIQDLYRRDLLAQGELEIEGERTDPRAIACPVLVLAAKDDPICLPHQALKLLDLVASTNKRSFVLPGGHVRSLTGPRARVSVAAKLAAWIDALGEAKR
jgi:polyhydroxyalkanoate synthase